MEVQKIPAVHICLKTSFITSESLHFVPTYDQKLPGPSASEGRRTPDQGKKRFEGKGKKNRRNNMPMMHLHLSKKIGHGKEPGAGQTEILI